MAIRALPTEKPYLMNEDEFFARLSMSAASFEKAVVEGRLFGVVLDGRMHYPSFFVDHRIDQRQLAAISTRLGDLPSGSKWQFFSTPKGSLGGLTPVESLVEGKLAMVKASAEGFRER